MRPHRDEGHHRDEGPRYEGAPIRRSLPVRRPCRRHCLCRPKFGPAIDETTTAGVRIADLERGTGCGQAEASNRSQN
jgi:hypothetical protein